MNIYDGKCAQNGWFAGVSEVPILWKPPISPQISSSLSDFHSFPSTRHSESIRRGRPPGGLCELCQHAEDSEGRVHQVPEVETGRPETSLPMGMIGFKPDSSLADAQVTLGVLHFKSPISLVMFGDPWLGMWGSPMITARSSKGG